MKLSKLTESSFDPEKYNPEDEIKSHLDKLYSMKPQEPKDNPPQQEEPPIGKLVWVPPSLNVELHELYNHAGNQDLMVTSRQLITAFRNGKMMSLSPKTWGTLENTDSRAPHDLDEIRKIAKTYKKTDEDINKLIQVMVSGGKLEAPTVWFRKSLPPFLIGGNTRLMLCRYFNIKPKIWAI